MGDRMRPIPFNELMDWIIEENNKYEKIFGINKFYKHEEDSFLEIFNERIETPFGPAAGPHTQLAQNIVAAYVTGCRFFELKTVQTLDGEDLPVSKPCIRAEDECYNVEWSTELRVPEAFEEYVKGWFALKLLAKELGLGREDGFIFNMSVGYDFDGISSPKIDNFIMGLKDASKSTIWNECVEYALNNLDKFKNIDEEYVRSISSKVCSSITLSTLHGCPPHEIERIARYLITEKGLNTYVKCNPTLLGYDFARTTLDSMGYDYISFDDHHFENDLQYSDAISMFKDLQNLAHENNLAFGVKLTNTFPVKIKNNELPGEEMYMSGKSLYPLSIALANKLTKDFDGSLKISYSGGADAFNINEIFDSGIWPITIATTLLKSGGYQRAIQISESLSKMEYTNKYLINKEKLQSLVDNSTVDKNHLKSIKPLPNRKVEDKVPLTDCFMASCQRGCPIYQDIPEYISLVGEGNHFEALKVIVEKNPMPFITGTICSHACMSKCTRTFYEESVNIRNVKLEAAENAYDKLVAEINETHKEGAKVAIIGGGTTGLSAAYFLAKDGMDVTIFESKDSLGGIVKHVIPEFRISNNSIQNDVDLVLKYGVDVKLNTKIDSIKELKDKGYKYILIATGAWEPGALKLQGEEPLNVINFLERLKNKDENLNLGKNVVVIGGGNTAMDAARAAKKAPGVENSYIVYRRTKKYMPADEEELYLAIEDGVEFKELLSPISFNNKILTCEVMKLGEPDTSGRRSPIGTGEIIEIECDTLIAAVGEKINSTFLENNSIEVNEKGFAKVNPITLESSVEKVYVAGDMLYGPATVVEGIAHATKVSRAIVMNEKNKNLSMKLVNLNLNMKNAIGKKGILSTSNSDLSESQRCLQCSTVCEACVDVCPNRANVSIKVQGADTPQIIHIDKMCNECGNCEIFCPYNSAPYKEKFTLFKDENDFNDSKNPGFVLLNNEEKKIKIRLNNEVSEVNLNASDTGLHKNIENMIYAVIEDYKFMI